MGMRLFVSIDLPEKVATNLAQVKEELLRYPVSVTPPNQLHATLCFIGEVEQGKAGKIIEKLKGVSFPRFSLKAKGLGAFPSPAKPRVVWVGLQAKELPILSEAIHSTLAIKLDKPYSGHATLARVKQETSLTSLVNRFSAAEFSSFEVKTFKLKQSALTPQGAVFTTLAKFPLQ